MKTTDNNEMDLLLRGLARDVPAFERHSGAVQSERNIGPHLDADQLNCYAEGVATGVERERYVKHLADCQSCRRLVASLVPVVGVLRRERPEEKTARSFRNNLTALLSPAVLRYALPALVLTSVLAIALIALRQQRQPAFVAQNQAAPTPELSKSSQPENVTSSSDTQTVKQSANQVEPQAKTDQNTVRTAPGQNNQPAVPAPLADANTTGEAKQDLRSNKTASAAQTQPTFAAPTEAGAPPPPPRPGSDDLAKMAETRKQEEEADVEKRRREDANAQMRVANESERAAGPKKGPSRASTPSVAGLSSAMSRDKDQKAAGAVVESRTVSGKVFRRQGNAWVDTNYSSDRTTISVRRGSEQFRALIADEPGLRPIADQLAGEVIVVWKGSAYRIH